MAVVASSIARVVRYSTAGMFLVSLGAILRTQSTFWPVRGPQTESDGNWELIMPLRCSCVLCDRFNAAAEKLAQDASRLESELEAAQVRYGITQTNGRQLSLIFLQRTDVARSYWNPHFTGAKGIVNRHTHGEQSQGKRDFVEMHPDKK